MIFSSIFWHHDQFLGIEGSYWKMIGWVGNAVFFSRFFVQWYASEKKGQVVVPPLFWYLSLAGSLLLLCYGLHQKDSVFIFAYAFTWIPYIRNLLIHRQSRGTVCQACREELPPKARFCHGCGGP